MLGSSGLPSLRKSTSGSAGTLTVSFDLGRGQYRLKGAYAGFGSSLFGNIKILLDHRETASQDVYVHSDMSRPSPGGAHTSIVTWEGDKLIDGSEYFVSVKGIANVTDVLYVTIDYEEESL